MVRSFPILCGVALLMAGGTALGGLAAGQPPFGPLGVEYAHDVRPLMRQYCLGCHSTAKRAGELDLERFAALADVRRSPKAWMRVAEMLDNGEMPPKAARQPSAP